MSNIGVVVEDPTDFETVRTLVNRIVATDLGGAQPKLHRRGGGGCSKIRRKLGAWADELHRAGCQHLLVVHDLDRDQLNGELGSEPALRRRLAAVKLPKTLDCCICIPVEEIEAWFWTDAKILTRLARGKPQKAEKAPEKKRRPKEALAALSWNGGSRPIYSNNMNPELAQTLDLDACAAACPSFSQLREFVRKAVRAAARATKGSPARR